MDNNTLHHFSDGLYAKQMSIPKGADVASNATTAGSNIGFSGTWRNMMPGTCFNSNYGFWLRIA